jgi:hypothetical protein
MRVGINFTNSFSGVVVQLSNHRGHNFVPLLSTNFSMDVTPH